MSNQTPKGSGTEISGEINGKHFSGEAFIQEMLTFAPQDYARIPAGTLDEHEGAIAILAKRNYVELLDVHGESPAGIFDAMYWRRTSAAAAEVASTIEELMQRVYPQNSKSVPRAPQETVSPNKLPAITCG